MVKLAFFILGLMLFNTPLSLAGVVAQSDTGIVFGDIECGDQNLTVGPISQNSFFRTWPDYLAVEVNAEMRCVDSQGYYYYIEDSDWVIFPTLQYNVRLKAWEVNGEFVAWERPPYGIELNPDFMLNLWTSTHPTHVSFAVQFKTPE